MVSQKIEELTTATWREPAVHFIEVLIQTSVISQGQSFPKSSLRLEIECSISAFEKFFTPNTDGFAHEFHEACRTIDDLGNDDAIQANKLYE